MKISALQDLIVLSQSTSINEAAGKLYTSQPRLSKTVHRMEDELGFSLFRRSNAGTELTPQGRIVLEGAKKIVEIYESWHVLAESSPLDSLRVYTSVSFSDFLVPDAILEIKEKYPHLHISYHTSGDPGEHITPDLSSPVIALAICDRPQMEFLSMVQGSKPRVLMSGSYQCLINRSNPLAGSAAVSTEDLKEQFLMLPTTSSEVQSPFAFTKPIMTSLIQSSPSHVIDVDSLENVINSVRHRENSYAVSFYPALLRYSGAEDGTLVHLPFSDLKTDGSLCMFYSDAAARKYREIDDFVRIILQKSEEFCKNHPGA